MLKFDCGKYQFNTHLAPLKFPHHILSMIGRWKDHLTYPSMWKPLCNFHLHFNALTFQYLHRPLRCSFDVIQGCPAMPICQVNYKVNRLTNHFLTAYVMQSSRFVCCVDINSICRASSPKAPVVHSRSGPQSVSSMSISVGMSMKCYTPHRCT
jgi:hypothetical protein